jgi:hypothetical protein
MKKLSFLFVAAVSLLFVGCDIHEHYETYEVKGSDLFVDYIDANGDDWQQYGVEGQPGCYVYQEFRFDEINQKVLNGGAVLVYLVDADNRDNILPYVFPVDNGHELIMQNIRYEVELGRLAIVIEWQDFKKYIQDNYKFKVCIITPAK